MRTLLLAMLPAVAYGCAPKHEMILPGPAPQPVLEWKDLVSAEAAPPFNGYALVEDAGSVGRFPCALAVAKIKVDPNSSPAVPRALDFDWTRRNEMAVWNNLLDNILAVTSVFGLEDPDLQSPEMTPDSLVAAAGRQKATMCLVYGRSDPNPDEVGYIGVLYECPSGTALATLHCVADPLDPDAAEQPPGRFKGDKRHVDPHCLAMVRFEMMLHKCVRQLVQADRPSPEKLESEWKYEQSDWFKPWTWPPHPQIKR